jgi:hypothetical protein
MTKKLFPKFESTEVLTKRIEQLEEGIESVRSEKDWDAKEMALIELYKLLEDKWRGRSVARGKPHKGGLRIGR